MRKTKADHDAPWIAWHQPRPGRTDHELIWAAVGAAGLALCWTSHYWQPFQPPCPFKTATGFPCPACGATRALLAWSRLDFTQAAVMNPLAALLALAFSLYWVYALATLALRRRRRLAFNFFPKGRRGAAVRLVLLALLTANWIYLIRVNR